MKFTLSWLKDHLDTSAPLAEIVETLTRVGLEVEGVEDPSAKYDGFVVARVIEAMQHPNADRLKVCMVDAGAGPVQVVCGAPNARTGMKSVFSPVGTYIPGKKITLAKGVIRGVESNGMLCSAAELELGNDHDGIMELPDDAPVGIPYARWAGLDDPVIDVALTPNRPDATGVSGIARDLAAAGLGTLRTPAPKPVGGAFRLPDPGASRFRLRRRPPLPGLRAAAGPRRPQRCVARMDAETSPGDRAQADQRAGRHHQLRDLRPRPPLARVRLRQGGRRSDGAARAPGGERARARRQNLCAGREHGRHRRRPGRRIRSPGSWAASARAATNRPATS